MVKLELTESEYESLLLKYELGKLMEGEIVEEDVDSMLASSDLHQKLYKSAYEGGSKVSIKNENSFKISASLEDEVDDVYGAFINYVQSGAFEKEMDNIRKEIEEMKKKEK